MPDIHTETRFTPNYLMREHGIVSGMSVVIEGRERPFGVLNASAKHSRHFTENDINFLKSIANVLAAAIERKQAEDALHRSEQAAQKSALEESVMAEIGRIIGSTLENRRGLRTMFAPRLEKNPLLRPDRHQPVFDFETATVPIQYIAGLDGRGPARRRSSTRWPERPRPRPS